MKCFYLLLAVCLISSRTFSSIFTVSNNPAFPGQFTSIQAAMDAAAPGDTIYVMPSGTLYGESLTCSKKVVMIGGGINPQRPSSLGTSINGFIFSGSGGSGSTFAGIKFTGSVAFTDFSNPIDNLTVTDCDIVQGCQFLGNNMVLEDNIFGDVVIIRDGINNLVQNNIFNNGIHLKGSATIIIRNNIFASGDASKYAFGFVQNGDFWSPAVKIYNNIFFKINPTGLGGVADLCDFRNNIYFLTNNPPANNPVGSGNVNADPAFVNFPAFGADFDITHDYHLQPNSPGINYGNDGKDVGAWGGFSPINKGFEPPIPRIYELKVNNPTVPVGGTLQLTIKATKAQ